MELFLLLFLASLFFLELILMILVQVQVIFYWFLDLLLFGRRKWFFCAWLEEVELLLILQPYGMNIFLLVFLLIVILNVKELFSLVEGVLFNFILSDKSFLFNWSWIRFSYYICFLRWRNFRLFLWFELCS